MIKRKPAAKSADVASTDIEFCSLATKYRPKVLEDLVGQDKAVTELTGMLNTRRFPHAFLFTGDSGVGKTTTARMIARYINCENPDSETHAPCGECTNCQYVDDHPDVMEINVADTRGIDDIRSLIQTSKNMPTLGKYRVFILDECHQLTAQAAQALLKPLEDPPKRTLWILATTNPEKLPTTVIGRCHRFHLSKIEEAVIVKRLYRIAKSNGVDFKTDLDDGVKVLKTIANFAEGRMRNSIQMLETALFAIKSGKQFDADTLIKKYATTDEANLEKSCVDLVCSILKSDLKGVVRVVRTGGEPRGILYKSRFLIQYLLDSYIGAAKFTPYSGRLFATVSKELGVKVSIPRLLKLQLRLVEVEQRMNTLSIDEAILLMSGLADMIADQPVKGE